MSIVALIPARLDSTRLQKKMLKKIGGTPLIVTTYKNLINFNLFDEVAVITDSLEISKVLDKYSIKHSISKKTHETGTDRIAEFANSFDCEIIINVQGDEPFLKINQIEKIIEVFNNDRENEIDVVSLMIKIDKDIAKKSSVVKVNTDTNRFAVQFTRQFDPKRKNYFKHIGVYAFRKSALKRFSSTTQTINEKNEKIEAIRLVENNFKFKMIQVYDETISIDTPSDLENANKYFEND